jgi:tetratricopeptide (TPR) repeat protein
MTTGARRPPAAINGLETLVRSGFLLVMGVCAGLACWTSTARAADLRDCERLYDGRGYEDARLCFDGYVAAHPGEAAAAAHLGRTYLAERQTQPAVDWLKKAVALDPARSQYHDWLGQAYGTAAERGPVVRQFGLAIKARREFERAVELDPADLDACEDLIEFLIQAPAFLGGSYEQARLHAAELGRRDALRGRLALAGVAMRQYGPASAERDLRAAAADFPADARPRLALAGLLVKTGRYEPAFEALEAAVRLDPENLDAYVAMARAAVASGQRLERAEELLGSYLKRLPAGDCADQADARFELAALLQRRGDLARARQQYEATLRLDPGLGAAREALRKLARFRPTAAP